MSHRKKILLKVIILGDSKSALPTTLLLLLSRSLPPPSYRLSLTLLFPSSLCAVWVRLP